MINCNFGFKNTGTGCLPPFAVIKKIILVPYFNSVGVINTIDTTAALNQTFFDALINQADPSKRWFPLPFMKNASNMREASVSESFDDGSAIIVQQGVRKFTGLIIEKDASPMLLGRLKSGRNLEMGFYGVDKDGNIIGVQDKSVSTNLNPIRIDANSIDPVFNPGEDKVTQKITYSFNIHVNEVDEQLQMIAASEMSIDAGTLKGLLDVSPVYTLIDTSTAETFTVQLNTSYGTLINPQTVTGLVAADFKGNTGVASKVYDVTAAADVAITSVTERLDANGRPSGIYDFVLGATITAGHVVKLSPSKNGFDFTQVVVKTFASV